MVKAERIKTHPLTMGVKLPTKVKSGQVVAVQSPLGGKVDVTLPNEVEGNSFLLIDFYTGKILYNQAAPYPATKKEEKKVDEAKGKVVLTGTTVTPTMSSHPKFPSWFDFKKKDHQPVGFELSNPKSPLVDVTPSGRKKALLIGLNYGNSPAPLCGSVNDAFAMREFLMSKGFENSPETMVVLFDECPDEMFQPTYANIIKGLQWLVEGASQGDTLFLHFSGHCGRQIDTDGHAKDGTTDAFVPMDVENDKVGLIQSTQIYDIVASNLPNGCRLFGLFDTPHFGQHPLNLPFWCYGGDGSFSEETNSSFSEGDVIIFSSRGETWIKHAEYLTAATSYGGFLTQAFLACAEQHYGMELRGFTREMRTFIQNFPISIPTLLVSSSQKFTMRDRKMELEAGIIANLNKEIGKKITYKQSSSDINYYDSPMGLMLKRFQTSE